MAATFSPDNAIAWVQIRLRGGWRNLAITGAAYAVVVGGGIYGSAKLLGSSPAMAYGGWLTGLLGLQSAVLLLFGASRIGAAIRLDHASRMIESHRLMPIGAGQAIFGYLAGATSQAIVLAAINVALGAIVAAAAGIPIGVWLAANFVLAAFCAFIWVVSAFWAFLVKAPFALFLLLGLGSWFSQGLVIELVPALTALAGPLMGKTVFSLRASATEPSFAYAVSLSAQVFIGTLCFIGAARRFRRGDAPAFTLPMSLLLLAGWVAISCLTILRWDDFKPEFLPGQIINTNTQLIGSLLSSILLALTPIASSARAQCQWRVRVPNDPRQTRRPLPFPLVVVAATLIVLCLTCVEWPSDAITVDLFDRVLGTASVVFLFLLSAGYLLQVLIRCGIRPVAPVLIWLALSWFGPLLGDVIRFNLLEEQHRPILESISTCSPVGALLQTWSSDSARSAPVNTALGIAVQALVAVAFFVLDARTRRTRRG